MVKTVYCSPSDLLDDVGGSNGDTTKPLPKGLARQILN